MSTDAAVAGVNTQAPTTNMQTGATQTTLSTTVGSYINPLIGEVFTDASAGVGTMEQQVVSVAGINRVFDVTLTEAEAVKILNSFRVVDTNTAVTYDASGNPIDANSNKFAQADVFMKNDAEFKEVVSSLLSQTNANGAAKSAGVPLLTYLKNENYKDTVDILGNFDTLPALLQGSDLLFHSITLDASGGATNMYNTMDNSANLDFLRTLFSQIPEARWENYVRPATGPGTTDQTEDVSGMNFLPLLKGDKLTFVFDVTIGTYDGDNNRPITGARFSSQRNQLSGKNGTISASYGLTGAASYDGSGSGFAGGSVLITTPTIRRVAIRMQLGSGDVPFAVAGVTPADDSAAYKAAFEAGGVLTAA